MTQNGLTNASSNNSAVGEAAVGRFIDLTALEASDAAQLTLRFDYTTADPNEVLYVHLWGCVDLDPSQNIQLMNLGAQNGNAWVNESAGIMDVYNLGKPDGAFSGSRGSGSDAAAILTGSTGPQLSAKPLTFLCLRLHRILFRSTTILFSGLRAKSVAVLLHLFRLEILKCRSMAEARSISR